MKNPSRLKGLRLKVCNPGLGAALILLTLTQIPIAVKTLAELACIGEVSNQIWKQSNSHRGVNVIAVQKCNGG